MLLPGRYKGTRKRRFARPRTLDAIFGIAHLTGGKEYVDMPDRDKYFQGGDWLKAKDVKNGQLLIIEEFGEAKTRLGLRPYLKFKGFEQPFGLNATNFDQLVVKFGENEKTWAGKKLKVVIVSVANPSAGGKMQPGIRFE